MKMEFLKTRFAPSLAAAILVAAQIGGCGKTAEPTSEVTSLADARTISARPDGRFDVVCQDGTQETITEDQLRANDVCNSASPVEPAPTPPFVTELPDRTIEYRRDTLPIGGPVYLFSSFAAESISFSLNVVSNQAKVVDGQGQAWRVSRDSGVVPFFSLRTPVRIYHQHYLQGRHTAVNFELSDIKIHRTSPLEASVSKRRAFTSRNANEFPFALGLVEGYVSFTTTRSSGTSLTANGYRFTGDYGVGYSRYEMVKLPVTLSMEQGNDAITIKDIQYYITKDVVLDRERITTHMAPSHLGAPGAQTWSIADQKLAYSGRKLTFLVDVKFFNNFLSNECTVVKFGDSVFNHAQTSATVSVIGTVQAKIESICATSRLENPENSADIEIKTKLIAVGGLPQ